MTAITPRPSPVSSFGDDTAALKPGPEELILAAVPLIDHRTRRRLVSAELARRGAYLGFDDGERTLLYPLDASIVHIGRSAGSELRIEERRVSRDHAIVARHGRQARLLDNRSANGTFVNGRRIVAITLADGDVIRIGSVLARYVEVR